MKGFPRKSNKLSAQLGKIVLFIVLAACAPAPIPDSPAATFPVESGRVPAAETATDTPIPTDEPTEIPTSVPTLPTAGEAPSSEGPVNGIILFIGDGMGITQRTAGRWVAVGQNGLLAMDQMQVSGWQETSAFQNPVTDSAAAGTAIATGYKTRNNRVGVDSDENAVPTILEQAKQRGWATGLVTNTPMTHATPASFAAHTVSRNNYEIIAEQMFDLEVDVLLGGGENDWLPVGTKGCYPFGGGRDDGRNLIEESQAKGYAYVCDQAGLLGVDTSSTPRLLGLFADDGFRRPFSPTLAEMTKIAIEILSQDEEGFFLMVEAGQIDWAGHDNDPEGVFESVAGFDEAVALGQAYQQAEPNTLLIVTADHETGGMSIYFESTGSFREDGPFAIADGGTFYVTWLGTSHTGVDVPVTASGPWAYLLAGHYANTFIYEVMWAAMNGVAP